jgi:F-type H+-transporting ATPase subunit gamma
VATLREIRRRIKSVKSTAQITKAMELVAASKMRRAQDRVLASRPYAEKMQSVLGDLAAETASLGSSLHPLLAHNTEGKVCLVLLTSDRGLSGSFNTNIIRHAIDFITTQRDNGDEVALVTVGKRGRDFMARYGMPIVSEFTGLTDKPTILDVAPIVRLLIDDYTGGTFKSVFLAYNQFVSTMTQRAVTVPVMPIERSHLGGYSAEEHTASLDYIFEPGPEEILSALLPRYVEVQMYQALLESIASEQSARMVAMRNATDNANEIIDSLTLTYNKARQAAITRELIDIATSASAID